MSKKFTNEYCVHCLGFFDNLTRDHIFPESWYPDSTHEGMEKWVAPACPNCNNKLGRIEEESYKKLALSVGKNCVAASGVSEKVTRMYNPSIAKIEQGKNRKISNIKKIIPDLIHPNKIPTVAYLKNCDLTENNIGKPFAVHVPFKLLNPFAEKIIRGLEYKFRNKLIDISTREIKIIYLSAGIDKIAPKEMQELNNILNNDGVEVNCGPGFIVRHVIDKFGTSLYKITIWSKIELLGSVSNKDIKKV